MNLVELAEELERQKKTKKDYVVNSNNMVVIVDKETNSIKMDIPIPDHPKGKGTREAFPLTNVCHTHIAEKTPIGTRYYKRMLEDGKLDLLKDNIMEYLPTDDNRMVRLLDTEADGIVRMRAMLSNSYRIIDNYDVLMNAMDICKNKISHMNIEFKDVRLSETRLYIKAISKKLIDDIHTLKGRDVIEGGVLIMNSEVGFGKYKCIPFLNVVRCTNGLIGQEAFTKVHLGLKMSEGLIDWSDETLRNQDELLWSQITDVITATFNPEIMQSWVNKINEVSTVELEEPTIALNNIVKTYKIPKNKRDDLLMHFGNEEPTLWGISNAVTRMAKDEQNYDNQIEYEEIGRKILEMKPKAVCKQIA